MNKKLGADQNIVRYCKPGTVSSDKSRVSGEAFRLRNGELDLSVYCLGLINADSIEEKIKDIVENTDYAYKRNGRFAELNVGNLISAVMSEFQHELSVINDSKGHDSHCGIFGLTFDDGLIAEYIAEEVVEKLHAALV